jgi:hypothetical protein
MTDTACSHLPPTHVDTRAPVPFFYIPNLAASQVRTTTAPWDLPCNIPNTACETKGSFRSWSHSQDTDHAFLSLVEASSATHRVSSDNPGFRIHGLIVDYDAEVHPEDFKAMDDYIARHQLTRPNYALRTYSGHARLVFLFDGPVNCANTALYTGFCQELERRLQLRHLLPGLDTGALRNMAQYYELGTEWEPYSYERIPVTALHATMAAAGDRVKLWAKGDAPDIPVDRVAVAVERKYPGVWQGPFEIGARGTRFWDPSADNPTAVIIRESGCQCFTGEQAFVTWAEILGRQFVEQFEQDTFGAAAEACAFDGKVFWAVDADGKRWRPQTADGIRRLLTGDYMMDSKKNGGQLSKLDRCLLYIQKNRCVDTVGPFVHFPHGFIPRPGSEIDGGAADIVLNTASRRCLPPQPAGERPLGWGEGFPWLAAFFDSIFAEPAQEQKEAFLCWWRWFYMNGLRNTPQLGQGVYIVGPASCGKTLLSNLIVGASVGGFADGSSWLVGEETFNGHLTDRALMAVDDSSPTADAKEHRKYSAKIKALAANGQMTHRSMYMLPQTVTWHGRVIVTCNLDPSSLEVLPSLELSNRDKISLFLAQTPSVAFSSYREENIALVKQELPAMLRWLLDWNPPAQYIDEDSRYHVRAYHHRIVLQASQEQTDISDFVEILQEFLDEVSRSGTGITFSGGGEYVFARPATLHHLMSDTVSIASHMRQFPLRSLRRALRGLESAGYCDVTYLNTRRVPGESGRVTKAWRLPLLLTTDPVEYLNFQRARGAAETQPTTTATTANPKETF